MDLTPLIGAETGDLVDFTLGMIDRLRAEVRGQLERALGAARG